MNDPRFLLRTEAHHMMDHHTLLRTAAEAQEAAYARGKRRLHIALGVAIGVALTLAWGWLS